jgi:hypothetical protein
MIAEHTCSECVTRLDAFGLRDVRVSYHTAQPAPTQWIAVGVVTTCTPDGLADCGPSMLVGSGRTEQAAIRALFGRLPAGFPILTQQNLESAADPC